MSNSAAIKIILIVISLLFAASAQARFLQTDPVGYQADPNLYTYVRNDPLDASDPLGTDVLYSSYGGGAYYYGGGEVYVGKALDLDALENGQISVATYITAGGGLGMGAGVSGGGGIFFGSFTQFHGGFINGNVALKAWGGIGGSVGRSCGTSQCNSDPRNTYIGANIGLGTPQASGSWTNTWFTNQSLENVNLDPFVNLVDTLSSRIKNTSTIGSRIAEAQKERALRALQKAKSELVSAQKKQDCPNPSKCPK